MSVDRSKYTSQIKSKTEDLRRTKMIETLLAISVLLMVIMLITKDSREKTILVPIGLKKEVWIRGNKVSTSYVEEFSLPLFNHLLTFNKLNAHSRFNFVLKHTDPKYYEELKSKLYSDGERITRNDISSVFHPIELIVKRVGPKYQSIIKGELISLIGSDVIKKKIESFEMVFSYRNNFLSILSYGPKREGEINE